MLNGVFSDKPSELISVREKACERFSFRTDEIYLNYPAFYYNFYHDAIAF